jgi:hypothetical protein
VFVGLSLVDLVLTWRLVEHSEGQVYEGNPIAGWFLGHAGWLGLIAFKLATVSCAGGLAATLVWLRPRTGRFVLTFACLVVGGVVLYSSSLAGALAAQPEKAFDGAVKQSGQSLTQELRASREYRALLGQLKDQWIAQRCTLGEAVHRLAQTERGRDARWLGLLREHHPGLSDEACLAANFVQFTVHSRSNNPATARGLEQRLEIEFTSLYSAR